MLAPQVCPPQGLAPSPAGNGGSSPAWLITNQLSGSLKAYDVTFWEFPWNVREVTLTFSSTTPCLHFQNQEWLKSFLFFITRNYQQQENIPVGCIPPAFLIPGSPYRESPEQRPPAGADPGFPLRGGANLQFCSKFSKNCMKVQKFWSVGGRPLRSATALPWTETPWVPQKEHRTRHRAPLEGTWHCEIALWINVRTDDWTAVGAIIATDGLFNLTKTTKSWKIKFEQNSVFLNHTVMLQSQQNNFCFHGITESEGTKTWWLWLWST